ncbi:MAG TPA: hypothetical protein VFV50_13865 [Bdellovibrionales bacterium]|nr:hypothetical protein [Bdellovibrionales bacterium]
MSAYKRWLFENDDIRPYVYMRPENRPQKPGRVHDFEFPDKTLFIDPLALENADFATMLLALENTAFKTTGLTLPRWALYDCHALPGLTCGFVHRTRSLPDSIRKVMPIIETCEWTPLSLFIAIPAVEGNHWVACNLCSVNSLLPREKNYSCLGFLSKAFGLWYSNIENLYGVTQWSNQALTVHTSFGLFELVTAYTPVHNIPASLTYRAAVDSELWHRFIETRDQWVNPLKPAGFDVNPADDATLIGLHKRIRNGEGPFFLNPDAEYKNSARIPIYTR